MSYLRSLPLVAGILLLTSLLVSAQNVTTWHNDNFRTGWQRNENVLMPSTVSQNTFGLIWQYNNSGQGLGHVYAQPLAVAGLPTSGTCLNPCSLVIVATEEDMLYAFNAASGSQTPVWNTNLASAVAIGATYVTCSGQNLIIFAPCEDPQPVGSDVGVTGTPVIDADSKLLYVVASVQLPDVTIGYYLFAVRITDGTVMSYVQINGSVTGLVPNDPDGAGKCTTTYPNTGSVSFDSGHIQRAALLLLNHHIVYIPFSPSDHEWENGWIFGYSFDSQLNAFAQVAILNTTPYGTGGGIWQAGAGLAAESDASYVYGSTGNGTFDLRGVTPIANDIGDSMLKMSVNGTSGALSVADYYAPSDILTYPAPPATQLGRCLNDEDFASGGVLLFEDTFYTDPTGHTPKMMVNADKESRLYILNRDSLGHYNQSDGNFIERVDVRFPVQDGQGFWASPAYWKSVDNGTSHYRLYYSVTTHKKDVAPFPLDMYDMLTSGTIGPISKSGPTASSKKADNTPILFCAYSPTPTVSSNGATGGIVWAIENTNADNPIPGDCIPSGGAAALHAFDATTMIELYSSRGLHTAIARTPQFVTPTVFQGRVYMGTTNVVGKTSEMDVFGRCGSSPLPACLP